MNNPSTSSGHRTWTPRIVVFQCQYSLYCEADQRWMDTQLPLRIKLIKVPCTGRISPLFVLNAIQGGADGVLISGCLPEKCHFKEGNLGARRQLDEFWHFLTYLGMEEERMRFAWIDLSERGRIQQELADLEETIRAIGPLRRLVTRASWKLEVGSWKLEVGYPTSNLQSPTSNIQFAIRQEAARILEENIVDVVIGFEAGTLPLKAQPAFITRQEEAEKLVHNGFCQNNLASYLTRRPKEERVGIICRGCESRAVRALVLEHQHDRDKLYLIGVPCTGIIDWRKIEREVGENTLQAVEEGDEVIVTTLVGEHRFQRADVLHDSCQRCLYPNPVGADIVLGDPLPEGDPERAWAPVLEFEALPPEERHAYFVQEAERCIRCYACREACPMCYCAECFVDYTTPRWAESMITPSGTQAWHIIRAFHQTGRCVSCGACERACPMDIKMTYLIDKLNYDMVQQYGFEVGASDEEQPPFAAFTLDDKNRFVR